jgi:hypothetical protein
MSVKKREVTKKYAVKRKGGDRHIDACRDKTGDIRPSKPFEAATRPKPKPEK